MRESIHTRVRGPENAKAIEYGRRAGYATGGAVTAKKTDAAKDAVADKRERAAKHKRASGGVVPGAEAPARLDKRARGGHVGKRGPKTNIIIHAGAGGDQGNPMALQQAKQEGAKMGAMAVIQKIKGAAGGGAPGGPPPGAMPGGPPPGGPPMGAAPPMGAGMPPMHAKGGRVVKVKSHKRRCAGGAVMDD